MSSETNTIARQNDSRIDQLEASIVENLELIDCPLTHRFTKGIYIREIFMPAGTLVTSKIHKTQHPYTISKGKVLVSIDGGEWVELNAPYTGITIPGTRRVLVVVEDTVWTTYHPCSNVKGTENSLEIEKQLKIVDRIESRIIQKRENKLLKNKEEQLWLG